MSNSPYTFETTAADFPEQVVARSHQAPVLVDFWAAWCQPCQMLMPLLQRLVEDYQGKFWLAKVNADEEPSLAAQYGIRSLPTLKLFRDGEIVEELAGIQPEPLIRAVIDRYLIRESDRLLAQAQAAQAAGQGKQALNLLRQAVEEDPENRRTSLALARTLFEQGAMAEAERILRALPLEVREEEPASGMLAHLEFATIAQEAPPAAALQQRITTNPQDSEARYLLGVRETLSGHYEKALVQFMELLKHDPKYKDEAPRKALLAVFNILGSNHDLVNRYRRQMFRYLH